MTSMFDQYENEQANLRSNLSSIVQINPSSGYVNVTVEEEAPLISIQKLRNFPTLPHRITHLQVSGDTIVVCMSNNTLVYGPSKSFGNCKEIDLNKFSTGKIRNIFLDPTTGSHLLVSTSLDLYYISTGSTRSKVINKMHGNEVTAIGWNLYNSNAQSTSPILLGTSKGLIFEGEMIVDSDKLFQSGSQNYCKQVFDIGKGNNTSVTGIEIYRFPSNTNRYFIIATTAIRLYQFVGTLNNLDERPLLINIFNNYLNIPEGFVEIPNNNSTSKLCVYSDYNANNVLIAKMFAWFIDGVGIMQGDINVDSKTDTVCKNNNMIEYSPLSISPISFVITEFHVILLYIDYIKLISILSKQLVHKETFSDVYGKGVNIVRDVINSNVYVLTERTVLLCKITKEDRFVWKIYLDECEFELAKQYCKDNDQLNEVICKQAEKYFDDGYYERSALLFSEAQCSFEEIALKFLKSDQIDGLKVFLKKKLDKLKPQESCQITMITVWLIELYEYQLGELKNNNLGRDEKYFELELDFDQFLSLPQVISCIKPNREVVYKILASHGDSRVFVKLATIYNDFSKVIRHFINEGKIQEALDILENQTISKDLIYIFTSEIIPVIPKKMIDLLIKLGRNIDIERILPCIIFTYDNDTQALEIIRYLEFCVHSLHVTYESVNNYLITLYAKYDKDRLMQYLAMQGQELSMVNYDVRYALKLCQEYELTEACVQISALLGLWESAVDLALTVSIDLAKQTASLPPHTDEELCKKLWLKIAEHVVKQKNDIKQAMEFLQQCDNLIKIEDILPFFSDFTTIDQFKEAICSSLKEYNQNIEILKEEMEDAISSAETIRNDIQSFKNKYTTIQSSDVCSSCDIQLLLRPFYAFPCSHRFHTDCLIEELTPFLKLTQQQRLKELQRQLTYTPAVSTPDNVSVGSNSVSLRDQIKTEINSIVAKDCFFCGDIAIDQIDKAFIEEDDFDRIRQEWE